MGWPQMQQLFWYAYSDICDMAYKLQCLTHALIVRPAQLQLQQDYSQTNFHYHTTKLLTIIFAFLMEDRSEKNSTQQNHLSLSALPPHVPRTIAECILQLAATEKWSLTSKKKNFEELSLIFRNMPHPNKAKYIFLRIFAKNSEWNNMPRILLPLSQCRFANLKALTLGGNNIQSIQPLAKTHFLQLEEIWLWNNKLTQIRALRKLCAPSLRVIDLSSNLLTENPSWSECELKQLQNINLQKNKFCQLNNLVKLESSILRLKVNIINNKMPSILRYLPKEGNKIATYFFIRHCTVIYC